MTDTNAQPASTPGLMKAVGAVARSTGVIALSIVLVPALAAYVLIGSGSGFFRDRW